MQKTCENCLYWKVDKDEPDMGHCFRATSGRKYPIVEEKRTLKSGIAIRTADGSTCPQLRVLFGRNFGCINFYESPF